MSAHHRRRFASALTHCLLATGVTGALGCAIDSPTPPDPVEPVVPVEPVGAQERIDHQLGRLAALDVLEITAVATKRTEHQWVPYGGTWNSSEVEMDQVEQANRLQSLADMAEQAIAQVDAAAMTEFSGESLCYQIEPGKFCLTIAAREANLTAVNELEIVQVTDIIRSAPAVTGFCYSSWETVGEDDCLRAHQLGAIADATRDFPRSVPPDQAPE